MLVVGAFKLVIHINVSQIPSTLEILVCMCKICNLYVEHMSHVIQILHQNHTAHGKKTRNA